MNRILRVFPRRTAATPTDELAFVGDPPMFLPRADEVHVSVAFRWDLREAERLERAWRHVAPVRVGGPALGGRSEGDFVPGRYLRDGYVITSRGCPNRCWFCDVWHREGAVRELPIRDGWNVLDDNLLACSDAHVEAVFAMLARQQRGAEFTGGLEAKRLKPWHVEALAQLRPRPRQVFFAMDTPDDLEPLREAGLMLRAFGFAGRTARPHRALRCYVLIGHPHDTICGAQHRLREVIRAGFKPMAMLWRDPTGKHAPGPEWHDLQAEWARPARIWRVFREEHPA